MKRLVVGAVSAGVVAASLLAVGTTASAGEVLLVDDDGLQCATEITSISAALDLASNGDTIQVCPGRYVVDADNAINVSKSVSIIGPVEALTDVDARHWLLLTWI